MKVCMHVCACVIGRVVEELEELICRTCGAHLYKYLQRKWQFVVLLMKIHLMYNFQVPFCSIVHNGAGFVYDFKPTVEYVPLVFSAL